MPKHTGQGGETKDSQDEKDPQPEKFGERSPEVKKEDHDERLPKDYFDLVGGTSTGGYVRISRKS